MGGTHGRGPDGRGPVPRSEESQQGEPVEPVLQLNLGGLIEDGEEPVDLIGAGQLPPNSEEKKRENIRKNCNTQPLQPPKSPW